MNDELHYLATSFAWSSVGFVIGWFVASLRHDLTRIKETVVPEEDPVSHVPKLPSAATTTRWLGVAVAVLAAATVVQGVIAQQRIGDVADCQAAYNEQFAAASVTRGDLAEQDREALTRLLLYVYRHPDQPQQLREAFESWAKTTAQNERERAKNPLPDYPVDGKC